MEALLVLPNLAASLLNPVVTAWIITLFCRQIFPSVKKWKMGLSTSQMDRRPVDMVAVASGSTERASIRAWRPRHLGEVPRSFYVCVGRCRQEHR